ncbi:MAG TPA: FHA domain-containing protein [Pyrinomonadaceae bacterium]|nr:FHA domain-containing protein [Pyrinomonadaceae bacterium]
MSERSTFIIVREDESLDPTTLLLDALKIGRSPTSDLLLNHPTVSRLHAGIKEIAGRFYLFNLSSSNSTTLNGRVVAVEQAESLASGDQVRIGPFFLHVNRHDQALEITVTLQIGLRIGEAEAREGPRVSGLAAVATAAPQSSDVADALDLFWGKRTREKAGRKTPLHPRQPPRLGKARFNWTPTRDLVRPWPFQVFTWSLVAVGLLSVAAAIWYTSAYSPAPVSGSHQRSSLTLTPAIAKRANSGSCTSCHALSAGMETRCASCHTTDAFVGTVTRPHTVAGIGCVDCHAEHRGKDFRPLYAALDSCSSCHNNQNRKTYNGKAVGRPHGGTFGYPVVNGEWKWKGLDADELAERPQIAEQRRPDDTERQWRSKQFHALHIYRVKATGGITGVEASAESPGMDKVMSCSSCHQFLQPDVDREFPRQTCAECHTGLVDSSNRTLVAADSPNCISCHVQHIKDKRHWNPKLLVDWVQSTAGGK